MAVYTDANGNISGSEDVLISDGIQRKTPSAKRNNKTIDYYSTVQAGSNVLNKYRSSSYNFTLAAITANQINNPELFDPRNPNFVVATSKGKSENRGINPLASTANSTSKSVRTTQARPSNITKLSPLIEADTVNVDPMGNVISVLSQSAVDPKKESESSKIARQNRQTDSQKIADSIKDFSKDSPGSFDLFIDDVSINSTFSFNNGVNSLGLHIDFEVLEPYSLNGFIEAMQICALAAGFNDYQAACWVLILDFMGYPDGDNISTPENVLGGSRVFFITITGIQVSVKDTGTQYKVSAVPLADRAAGMPVATLKRKTTAEGKTVTELLKNLTDSLNKQSAEDAAISEGTNQYDRYQINVDETIGKHLFYEPKEIIAPNNTKMTAYGQTPTQSTAAYVHTAHFDSGKSMNDIISAVVRDSDYIGKIIKAFTKQGDPNTILDANGFLDYFIITPSVIYSDINNPKTNKPYCTYTYTVEKYKILYNMAVPGTGRNIINAPAVKKFSLRNYNYFYTGLNVDVLDFKINLNNLFFEEKPKAMGNNQSAPSSDSVKRNNTENTVYSPPDARLAEGNLTAPEYYTAEATTSQPGDSINSVSPEASGWRQIVKTMHEKVANSVGLISGELGIMGDPYYLTASGSGNSLTKGSGLGQLTNQYEASVRAGQVLITVSFNNPSDIGKSGFMQFNNNAILISGLYQVTQVKSTFKDGVFKQVLNILRVPGQPFENQSPDNPADVYQTYQNKEDITGVPSDKSVAPSGRVTYNNGISGLRSNSLNLQSITPSKNSELGGLGGDTNPVFGAQNPAGNLPNSALYGIIPNGANQLATGIRASASGLYSAQNSNLSDAALAQGAAKILKSSFANSDNIINNLTNDLINKQYELKDKLDVNSLNAALLNVSGNLNNAANKISQSINQTLNDPFGLGNLFAVNASLISGLAGSINSKILSSLNGLSEVIPVNVNLQSAAKLGIQIDKLTPEGIANLPPIPAPSIGLNYAGFDNGNQTSAVSQPIPQFSQIDNFSRSNRLSSALALYGQESGQPLSVEANYSIINQASNLSKSVVSLYGSKSQNSISPLVAALNKNNII
jgi:hypothetical protein